MIIVRLIGGLGNQLFQYALGRYIAYINNTDLKLDITGFETYKLHYYSLMNFNITEDFATDREIRKFKPLSDSSFNKIFYPIKRLVNNCAFVEQKGLDFTRQVLGSKNNTYLQGYWQSEKYFKPVENIIREEFTVKSALSGKDKEIAQIIKNTESISLHVRRADYVSNPETNKIYGSIGLTYYYNALSIIGKKVNNPHIFIFSDDATWVKENLKTGYPVTYVDHNNYLKNYEDLRLMALCKHNIIPNSTFSWWGAWLNENPDKIVIAPEKWFNVSLYKSEDIIPDNWVKI